MAKSTTSGSKVKPGKPHSQFPLRIHPSGRFSKKLKGKLYYFGRWANSVGGELVRVDDFDAAAKDAEDEYKRDWHRIVDGQPRSAYTTGKGGKTVHDIAEAFYLHKREKCPKELSPFSLNE